MQMSQRSDHVVEIASKWVISIGLAVTTSLLLGGCGLLEQLQTNHLQGPVSLRLADQGLELAVCRDIRAEEVWVATWDDDLNPFWDATGVVDFTSGDLITAESLESAFDVVNTQEPKMSGVTRIEVVISDADDSSNNIVAAFDLKDEPNAQWLHPDGSLTDDPC